MARVCQLTGARPGRGNNVSHSNRKSKRRRLPNLQSKRIWIPELGRFIRLRVTTRTIHAVTQHGLSHVLKKNGLTLQDVV